MSVVRLLKDERAQRWVPELPFCIINHKINTKMRDIRFTAGPPTNHLSDKKVETMGYMLNWALGLSSLGLLRNPSFFSFLLNPLSLGISSSLYIFQVFLQWIYNRYVLSLALRSELLCNPLGSLLSYRAYVKPKKHRNYRLWMVCQSLFYLLLISTSYTKLTLFAGLWVVVSLLL